MKFRAGDLDVAGGVCLQSYKPAGSSVLGHFEDGSAAVVEHPYGNGKAILIGTCPGYGYYEAEHDPGSRAFFGWLLNRAVIDKHVNCSDHRLVARLHEGKGYHVLWIVNSAREEIEATLKLSERWGTFDKVQHLVNRGSISGGGQSLEVRVPARDVIVVKMI